MWPISYTRRRTFHSYCDHLSTIRVYISRVSHFSPYPIIGLICAISEMFCCDFLNDCVRQIQVGYKPLSEIYIYICLSILIILIRTSHTTLKWIFPLFNIYYLACSRRHILFLNNLCNFAYGKSSNAVLIRSLTSSIQACVDT